MRSKIYLNFQTTGNPIVHLFISQLYCRIFQVFIFFQDIHFIIAHLQMQDFCIFQLKTYFGHTPYKIQKPSVAWANQWKVYTYILDVFHCVLDDVKNPNFSNIDLPTCKNERRAVLRYLTSIKWFPFLHHWYLVDNDVLIINF